MLCVFLFPLLVSSQVNESNGEKVIRIYEEADRLYKSGYYTASIEYLKRESGNLLTSSDSLIYMKIRNLEKLYRLKNDHSKDMDATLKLFFSRVNKYSFPEVKYTEVATYYTVFQGFKDRDKQFYDSVVRVFDIDKTASLPAIKSVAGDYMKTYPNSYYTTELTNYINLINDKLLEMELVKKKKDKDSTSRSNLKMVGKALFLSVSYSVPSGGKGRFAGANNYSEAQNFFKGNYTGSMGEKYTLGASLGEVYINVITGNRAKLGINWNLFDAEYTVFDWTANNFIKESESSTVPMKELKSIRAGTRIGPSIAVLVSKSLAVSVYYSARPGIQFLMHGSYFSYTNGTGVSKYEVKPVIANYSLSNEAGLKIYFFKKLFIGPYLHFGNYKWQNDINDVSAGAAGGSTRGQTNYTFNYLGFRLGF